MQFFGPKAKKQEAFLLQTLHELIVFGIYFEKNEYFATFEKNAIVFFMDVCYTALVNVIARQGAVCMLSCPLYKSKKCSFGGNPMPNKPRARDLGIRFPGTPGKYNAITDVSGVEVGYSTIRLGEPEDYRDHTSAFARTGVTAILPRGKCRSAVFAGISDLNGNGEMTGTHWIKDSGFLHGPVMITNTNSVGVVRDAASEWMLLNGYFYPFQVAGKDLPGMGCVYPTVAETYDGALNNMNGFHVKREHALEALNNAKSGPVEEGNVGGGTAMRCHGFKGGTGTASRVLSEDKGGYTVGVLVQANHGTRQDFQIQGVSMAEIEGCKMINNTVTAVEGTGSIIVIIATDAPLLPHQLIKLSRRPTIGIGRLGGGNASSSGDIFLAFSTANPDAFSYGYSNVTMMNDDLVDPIFKAAADATEEAILNALCAAEDLVGIDFNTSFAMPTDQVVEILRRNGKIS